MKKGFTLVELVIVMSIISILATISTIDSINTIEDNKNNMDYDMKATKQLLTTFYFNNGQIPDLPKQITGWSNSRLKLNGELTNYQLKPKSGNNIILEKKNCDDNYAGIQITIYNKSIDKTMKYMDCQYNLPLEVVTVEPTAPTGNENTYMADMITVFTDYQKKIEQVVKDKLDLTSSEYKYPYAGVVTNDKSFQPIEQEFLYFGKSSINDKTFTYQHSGITFSVLPDISVKTTSKIKCQPDIYYDDGTYQYGYGNENYYRNRYVAADGTIDITNTVDNQLQDYKFFRYDAKYTGYEVEIHNIHTNKYIIYNSCTDIKPRVLG